ncbi:MAG: quinolinate synthase NadA [Myxococcota bacterium]|nr:quinolinate synthase NadA [Myxococcota bacterium]
MNSKQHLLEKIADLKKTRRAVILAHNYQLPEIQDMADFNGDSLELSRKAKDTDAEVIVFCGVHFMAETAALLSPEKTVLLPDQNAGCPMADMAEARDVLELRRQHPDALVVCYVNSTAAVKALSDVCCTSANAVDVVSRIPKDRDIIFVPDKYLGQHVERMAGRKLILWPGYCPTHVRLQPEHIESARVSYPGVTVMVHPECRPEVAMLADEVLSTGGMCRFARETSTETIAVGTEVGLLHRLKKENPSKRFIPLLDQAVCPNMKLTTLASVVWALENRQNTIAVDSPIREPARAAIERMLDSGPITTSEVPLD